MRKLENNQLTILNFFSSHPFPRIRHFFAMCSPWKFWFSIVLLKKRSLFVVFPDLSCPIFPCECPNGVFFIICSALFHIYDSPLCFPPLVLYIAYFFMGSFAQGSFRGATLAVANLLSYPHPAWPVGPAECPNYITLILKYQSIKSATKIVVLWPLLFDRLEICQQTVYSQQAVTKGYTPWGGCVVVWQTK